MDVSLSPVLRLVGDLRKVGHVLYGSVEMAERHTAVKWNEERGILIRSERISGPEALSYDGSVSFSGIRSLSNGAVHQVRRGIVGVEHLTGRPKVVHNNAYRHWSKTRLSKARSVGEHLADVATMTLLANDILSLHGAVVTNGEKAVLITGLPNVGKTTSTVRLIRNGFGFQAEDIALVHADRTSYGVPYTVSLEMGGVARFARAASSLVFKNSKLARQGLFEVADNSGAFVEQSRLEHIVILETQRDMVASDVPSSDVVEFLLAVNSREFPYAGNPLLIGAACCDPTVGLNRLILKEQSLMANLLDDTTVHRVGARSIRERVDRACGLIADLLS